MPSELKPGARGQAGLHLENFPGGGGGENRFSKILGGGGGDAFSNFNAQ